MVCQILEVGMLIFFIRMHFILLFASVADTRQGSGGRVDPDLLEGLTARTLTVMGSVG